MRLYLVQHGQHNQEDIDPKKNLSDIGKRDVQKMADFLKNAAVLVEQVYHSGKARAQQTAEILTPAVMPGRKPAEKAGLEPNDPVQKLADEVRTMNKDTMIVGHMPFLSKLASLLLTGLEYAEPVEFQRGGVVCLQKFGEKWQIHWMLVPDLLS